MNRPTLSSMLLAALALAACDRSTVVEVPAHVVMPDGSGEGIRVVATPAAASAPADSIYSITSPRNGP